MYSNVCSEYVFLESYLDNLGKMVWIRILPHCDEDTQATESIAA